MIKAIWYAIGVGGAVCVVVALVWRGFEAGMATAFVTGAAALGYYLLLRHLHSLRLLSLLHLQTSSDKVAVTTEHVPPSFRLDVLRSLEHHRTATGLALPVLGTPGCSLFGLVSKEVFGTTAPLVWESLPCSADDTLHVVTNGLYRLRINDHPIVAQVLAGRGHATLEIIAPSHEIAKAASGAILDWARRNSVFRGQVVSFDEDAQQFTGSQLRFVDLAPVPREAIVLPEDVLAVVDRNVGGLLQHAEILRRAGRSTRHGVLFHGPPGTGKTLVTRYLARACPDYTAIVLNGRSMEFVRESFRLAKLLAPALLILEDVDLIALDRRDTVHNTLLHDLLDEMDGLGRKSDCIIILTTNRPEFLEPALASRPGRVDQAILFPLPDLDCRRRLFALFSNQLDLANVDVDELLDRTEGASPAFLEELFRKATLLAAECGEEEIPIRLCTRDFELALRELLHFGGELTRNLLGFKSRAGFHASPGFASAAHDGNGRQ